MTILVISAKNQDNNGNDDFYDMNVDILVCETHFVYLVETHFTCSSLLVLSIGIV